MHRFSAILVSVMCAMIGIPAVGLASDGLAIVHPSDWDQQVSVSSSEGGEVYSVSGSDGTELDSGLSEQELSEKYPELYARAQSSGATVDASTESPLLPLAITPF